MSDDWDRDLPNLEDLGSQLWVLQLKFQQFEPLVILKLNNSQAQRIFGPTKVCRSDYFLWQDFMTMLLMGHLANHKQG